MVQREFLLPSIFEKKKKKIHAVSLQHPYFLTVKCMDCSSLQALAVPPPVPGSPVPCSSLDHGCLLGSALGLLEIRGEGDAPVTQQPLKMKNGWGWGEGSIHRALPLAAPPPCPRPRNGPQWYPACLGTS